MRPPITPEVVEKVWDKGDIVRGKDPDQYRRDCAGNVIFKGSYGKDTPMGWCVDHKKPVSKGGTNHLNNLQPLQTEENEKKNNQYPWKQ
ncbi:MAG: HNH endonuclease signature motif containing protein [Paludibacter sp.]